jgi:hypothetical protein
MLWRIARLEIINQKNHSGSWSAGAHRRDQAVFFSQIHEKQVYNYFLKPNSKRNMLKPQTTPLDDGASYLFFLNKKKRIFEKKIR